MSTIISRLKVQHPDLGDAGGVTLQADYRNGWNKFGDNILSRHSVFVAQGNATTFEVDHNLGVAFKELLVLVYSGTFPALTRIEDATVLADPWIIAAKAGSLKEVIEITTPTAGGPFTGTIEVIHNADGQLKAARTVRLLSTSVTLHNRRVHLVDSTGGAVTLTLPAPSVDLYIPIKDSGGDAANNNISIASPGAEEIELEAADYVLSTNLGAITIVSDGTDYFVI